MPTGVGMQQRYRDNEPMCIQMAIPNATGSREHNTMATSTCSNIRNMHRKVGLDTSPRTVGESSRTVEGLEIFHAVGQYLSMERHKVETMETPSLEDSIRII